MPTSSFHAPWWLRNPHLQTMWGKLARRAPIVTSRVERWDTPDGDFVDVHRIDAPAGRPRLVLLHGLEGSPRSHYAMGIVALAAARGWGADVLVFRSCGSEPNRLLRSYHSGETEDIELIVRRIIEEDATRDLLLTGVSLGGNVLLKWLGELGHRAPPQIRAAAAVSVPFDLARSARYIDRGFARVYQAHFLRTLRRKAHEKARRFPGALRPEIIRSTRTIWSFDDVVTAPIHGFRDAADYYERSSSIRFLSRIRIPTLLLSARDDPFLPRDVLDDVIDIAREAPALTVEITQTGGHVGFVSGNVPWRARYDGEERVIAFLADVLSDARGRGEAGAGSRAPHPA